MSYHYSLSPCRWPGDHQKKSVWRDEEDEEESVPMLQQEHLQTDSEQSEEELLVRTESGDVGKFVSVTIQS